VPFFLLVSGWVSGMPEAGPGSRWSAPAGRTTLRPVLLAADTAERREQGCEVVGAPGAVSGLAGLRLRSSLRGSRGGWPRGHGAFRVRAAGSITGTAAPPVAGARPAGDHALPVSGPAHAAWRAAVRLASDLACPSRIA
jgi:hypothetical protein